MRKIQVIPATQEFTSNSQSPSLNRKRRVAGYARVSTDSDEQFTSYAAQVDYYTNMIKARADWEFVGIYTDEGISGTSTARREGFRNMVADALDGKIDLIVTKSVSRFARNTVDSLTTIRQLKEKKVEVFFEKESIWTFDSKGELLITIMSSIAQEESRSISENTKWGIRKRFADGKLLLPYSSFLGYEKGPDGTIVINEEEAKLVRYIYALFLQGKAVGSIVRILNKEGHLTPTGKKKWYHRVIESILTNEKYKGDALLQKKFTPDFLSKRLVKNKGEVSQYYVKESHDAIIEPDVFDLVQRELAYRKKYMLGACPDHPFSGRIRCGDCQNNYGRKIWHSNDKYRKELWQCNGKYKVKDKICTTPTITDKEVKELFLKALNMLLANKDELFKEFNLIKNQALDNIPLKQKIDELQQERVVLAKKLEGITRRNASVAPDQDIITSEFDKIQQRYIKVTEQVSALETRIKDQKHRALKTERFLKSLSDQESMIAEYSDELWFSLLDHMTIYAKDDIRFTFKNGGEIRVGK